jgi:hypothetical protein
VPPTKEAGGSQDKLKPISEWIDIRKKIVEGILYFVGGLIFCLGTISGLALSYFVTHDRFRSVECEAHKAVAQIRVDLNELLIANENNHADQLRKASQQVKDDTDSHGLQDQARVAEKRAKKYEQELDSANTRYAEMDRTSCESEKW